MTNVLPPETIAARARDAAQQLRDISRLLEHIDALQTADIPDWEYMQDRFFVDERNALLDIADILDKELAPEAESHARKR
ncbi:hypothetical protein [Corynebacterium sp.]|uniref:hypothetical protein n=1 Tax=Corynebacterium sp. TaxID=1720 RepID=UPI0026E0DBAB|nr:hypothetical protein [Corynebacterium sp.]MDO5513118.1 hypothetical protein [Corynebacterium sp.]